MGSYFGILDDSGAGARERANKRHKYKMQQMLYYRGHAYIYMASRMKQKKEKKSN